MAMRAVNLLTKGWKSFYYNYWEDGFYGSIQRFVRWQNKAVGLKARREWTLREYGLRYGDIDMPPEAIDVVSQEALRRLPPEVFDARNQRCKRACDLKMKKTCLPKEMQALQTPYEPTWESMYLQVFMEWEERLKLGAEYPRQGTIP